MRPLTTEQARALQKRIVKAIDKAKYHPAFSNPEAMAAEVVRPYLPGAGGTPNKKGTGL